MLITATQAGKSSAGIRRPRNAETLRQIAARLQQQGAVRDGYHPFGNDIAPERAGPSGDPKIR